MHMSLTEADKVIIVAHHLPLKIERAPAGGFIIAWDDERGLDKNGMKLPTDTTYIGCIELEVTDMVEQEQLEKELLDKWGCIVVFLEPEMKNRYYHGFCRGYLSRRSCTTSCTFRRQKTRSSPTSGARTAR